MLFSHLEIFSKCYPTLPTTYLQHDRLLGGAGGREVLHVPAALVEEGGPAGLVLPVPLDDVVAVEEVLLRRVAPESQEVTCLLHFLHQDVPRPSRYHTHVSVPCGNKGAKGGRVEVEVTPLPLVSQQGNRWPTMTAASLTSTPADRVSLIFNRGWAQPVGATGMCVCVCERVSVCVFSQRGGHCPVSGFYCVSMEGGLDGGVEVGG